MSATKFLTWCMVSVVGMYSGAAFAEVRPSDVTLPTDEVGLGPGYGKRGLQFQFDLHSHYASQDIERRTVDHLAVMPRLFIVQPVGKNEFEFAISAIHYSTTTSIGDTETSDTTLRFSNPSFTHFFTWRRLDQQIRLGLGVTLPLAKLRTDKPEQQEVDRSAFEIAEGVSGLKDRWLWRVDSMSAITHFDYYFRHRSGFIFGTQLIAAPAIRVGDSVNNSNADGTEIADQDDFGVIGQGELELAFDTRSLRTAVKVIYSTDVLSDAEQDLRDQIMVEPEFRVRLGEVDLFLGANINIDEPAGFAFDEGKYWGARIGFATPTRLMLPE